MTETKRHLRATRKTLCGLALYTEDSDGKKVYAVEAVADHRLPDRPVTCPKCLEFISDHPFAFGK